MAKWFYYLNLRIIQIGDFYNFIILTQRSIFHSRKIVLLDNLTKYSDNNVLKYWRNHLYEISVAYAPYQRRIKNFYAKIQVECEEQARSFQFYNESPSEIKQKIMYVRYEVS